MERDGQKADVHPKEVDNYEAGGWVKVKPKPKAKKPA